MNNIFSFPNFVPLSMDHKEIVEKYTSAFLPYADYNFFSLWCYNVENKITLCELNGNLVIKFQDYTSDDMFYSFIGKKKVAQTVEVLLSHTKKDEVLSCLKLMPSEILTPYFKRKLSSKYLVIEDLENFDYILDALSIASLVGHKLHQKRKMANKFYKLYNYSVNIVPISDPDLKDEITGFFNLWKEIRGKTKDEVKYEVRAINRGLDNAEIFENVFCLRMCVDNKLCGFSVFELLENEYIIGGFQKADINYRGIYEAINHQVAIYGLNLGYKYINIENDMGIEGLRRAKLDYNPTYLKKYIVSRRRNFRSR